MAATKTITEFMIKFTIVISTYNAEKELQRTLDSVQRQTYCNIEHIIMDGGSATVPSSW